MPEAPIRLKNMHLETNEDTTTTDADSNEKKFTITRDPKDIIYMLLFIVFGLWILTEFLLKANIFGDLSSMCGPFLVLGGVCFIFATPINVRKARALKKDTVDNSLTRLHFLSKCHKVGLVVLFRRLH